MDLKSQFIQTYQHHSPIENDFIGDLNRLIWSIENRAATIEAQERAKINQIDKFVAEVDRIIWSDQTASCSDYKQAYNKVKEQLLAASKEFRGK